MAVPEIVVKYVADTSALSAASGKLGAAGGKAAGAVRSAFLPAVGVLAAAGAAAFKAAGDASDLNETINKSNAIFGSSAKSVEAWSTTTTDAFGISQADALAAASQFGDMFQQLGVGTGQAAKLSTGLVELAGDLGSFHNREPAEVMEMISAAMRGEYDSLQALVPGINAARVEQEALAMTGKKHADQLTQQEKALATNAILFKDTAKAQGDSAKTADDAAGQQRRLQASMEDLSAQMGQALLPVMTTLLSIGKRVASWAKENPTLFKAMVIGILAVAAAVVVLNVAMMVLSANPIALIILAIVAAIALLIAAGVLLYKNFDKIKAVAARAWGGIKKAARSVIDFLKANWDLILPILFGPFGLAVLVIKRKWDLITRVVKAAKDAVVRVFQSMRDTVRGIVSSVADILGKLQEIFRRPIAWAKSAVDAVKSAFSSLVDWLRGLPGKIRSAISGAADALKGPLNAVIGAWNSLRLPGFDVNINMPGPVPDVHFGWSGQDLPDIPKLAAGGIVTRPTLAMLGESGPEAVVPLGAGLGPHITFESFIVREEIDIDRLVARLSTAVAVRR